MPKNPKVPASDTAPDTVAALRTGLTVLALLFVFLMGVRGLGDGFKLLGSDLLDAFFQATSNPFVALMVGLLATTLVQSSSVSTSMIVGLVAAPENPLPIENAIPMIMGTNIGTTVTNTIVALAHMGRKEEFRRAFAVATCHDFFNYMAVLVLLPLELATGFLRHSAATIAELFAGSGGMTFDSPVKNALKGALTPIVSLVNAIFEHSQARGAAIAVLSALLIFGALYMLVRTMRHAMQRRIELWVDRLFGRSALIAIAIGAAATVVVQSSSITTSLLVPLAGAGVLTLAQAFPVTLGANIGTTITALLASMAVAGENATAGMTVAVVHTLFNVAGTAMIYPVAAIREIPLAAARKLADVAAESRYLAIAYVVVLFYGLPALFAFLSS